MIFRSHKIDAHPGERANVVMFAPGGLLLSANADVVVRRTSTGLLATRS